MAYWQWTTRGIVNPDLGFFHVFLWFAMGMCAILGTIFNFMLLQIDFGPDGFIFRQPILGMGVSNEVSWNEIQGIARGATVETQGALLSTEDTSGGYSAVVSVIKVKTPRGILSMGADLKPKHRIYLHRALTAYYAAWKENGG